ncbi:hypothetical protein HO173_001588 [Letharia columbiana]|uniref:Uncharacterized protein n=1 Tax=Letharia columbiana TaxID=112416 RepID=A0A8H6G431_9LECA|nr:uncharacterized protein HO173_001588 [Letharia columbiana]KAF6239980.1 hypothetical protein HO173_001588 [Letharia columbiana]
MFVRHIFSFLPCWAAAILATAKMPNLVDAAAVNSSALGALSVRCDGALYGFNPNIADCEGAAQFIVPDSVQLVWGERHSGLPVGIFPLPFAVFGDKAECVVRTIVRGAGPTARASLAQVKRAAAALSLQCAAGGQSQGGIATNIGGDDNLAVILSTYKPKIQCGSAQTFSDASSCEGLLADMPASTAKVLFGPDDVPGVREPLPQLIASGDDKCLLRLFSTGRADSASWYSIWEATEATFARCARDRKPGSFRGLGDRGDIFFTLASVPSIGPLGNSSSRAVTA